MTRAAEASQEADTAIRLPLIEGIQADLAAINLSTVQLPKHNICSHFVPVGSADDRMKRLLVLRAATHKELEKLSHEAIGGLFSTIGDGLLSGGLDKLTEVLSGKLKIENSSVGEHALRRLGVLNVMLTDAFEIAYPEHVDRELLVKHDGAVGYLDHTSRLKEVLQEVKDAIVAGKIDLSGYPPEVVAAVKAGEYEVVSMGPLGFALRINHPDAPMN